MYDAPTIARTIAENWEHLLGTPLPKDVANAANTLHEVEYLDPPLPAFDSHGLNPARVGAAVEKHAAELAAVAAFDVAKDQARKSIAQDVIAAADAAVPALLEQLRPEFDAAVVTYTEAVGELPDTFTGDTIAEAPADVQNAYRDACEAAAVIRRVDRWLASLGDLPSHRSPTPDRELRVLAPTTRAELRDVMSDPKVSKAEAKLDGMYLNAARIGVAFEMHTPAEATALRKLIDAMPVVREAATRLVSLR